MLASDERPARPAGPRTGPTSAPRRPHTRPVALVVAPGAALGTWLVWWAMVTTWPGQRVEERVFETADRFQDVVNHLVEPVLLLGSPAWLAVGALVVCATGLLRRSWAATGLAVVVILGSNVTTQVIKDGVFYRVGLLGEWNRDINTLPSGHVTVVAAAWAALLLVVPRGWRSPTALVGAGATCAMGLATIADRWHRPSDVVAAVLVVVVWAAAACAVAPALSPARAAARAPGRHPGTRPGGRAVGATVALLAGVAVPTALASVLAAAATEDLVWAALPWDGGLTAYVGGLLAACAVSATAFAVLLALCPPASRGSGAAAGRAALRDPAAPRGPAAPRDLSAPRTSR